MKITAAKYEGGKLILEVPWSDAAQFLYKFVSGVYNIVKAHKKRSLTANSYCWALCTQIAKEVGVTKEEVYRRNIREGNEYVPMTIHKDALVTYQRVWSSNGIGWSLEIVDDALPDDYKEVFAYYGSSVYDTKQMSALLERIVQDAKSLGIETLSEREKSLLLEKWDEQKNKSAVDNENSQGCGVVA